MDHLWKTISLLATLMAVASGSAAEAAPHITNLFSFNGVNGAYPEAGLIADGEGNLYGTTSSGLAGDGGVFELSPPGRGQTQWTQKTIFSFNGTDGSDPKAGLIADGAGNLFGTTSSGGFNSIYGTVFELSPPQAGQTQWTETVLFMFNDADGAQPLAGLIADKVGNLYGTTFGGGAFGYGTVFKLSPPGPGQTQWTETVLLSFNAANGGFPQAGVIMDSAGNLYGTTSYLYGTTDFGTVFELSPPGPGQTDWSETTLFTFSGTNGGYSVSGLAADGAGNLYGTTVGRNALYGNVFELSRPGSGQTQWTEKTLFSFNATNGAYPQAGLILDAAGNLYGTTADGGSHGDGTVFELSPPGSGQTKWTSKFLAFNGRNGFFSQASLLADSAGNIYGTTSQGGAFAYGNVFEVSP